MTSLAVPRRAPAFKPLALALFICFSAPAFADEPAAVVTITGSRFESDPALQPIGATVITADEIRRSGVDDVNQAIRKIGGVYGRQSLDASPDFALDLRGFGANSSQNMVVMVDGVRMSENELAGSVLSTIPLDLVERIEIIRGGASVLFGEGATGGVIQIVTRRPDAQGMRGHLSAELGQFHQRDLRAYAQRAFAGGLSVDAAVNKQKTDNYRRHNAYDLDAANLGAQWNYGAGRVGVRVERAQSESELPGALSLAQFRQDARQSFTPRDNATLESERVSAFIEHRLGGLDLAAELSRRSKRVQSDYYFPDLSRAVYDSHQTQFSPRVRSLSRWDGMLNELVGGIDLTRWERDTTSSFSLANARQSAKAVYLRDEIKWGDAHSARLAVGARREWFDKDYAERAYATPDEHSEQAQNAWEVQGSVDVVPLVNLYARIGRSYRVANVDENSYRSSAGVLAIQTSRDAEVGVTAGDADRSLTVRAFRHALTDEIFYDPTLNGGYGANTNLDPTEREGVEADLDAALAPSWRASAHYQHVRARFRAGPNAGREMVQVPKNTFTARLSWVPGDGQSADVGVQWVASQRYGNDFANTCRARVPSYHTVDARYGIKVGAWEFAATGLNLADKRYFSNAFTCEGSIYPSDARQVKLSVRYDF
ncbi:MAG: TonB-dependent receptor [Gammaproteobacteria bacterium]